MPRCQPSSAIARRRRGRIGQDALEIDNAGRPGCESSRRRSGRRCNFRCASCSVWCRVIKCSCVWCEKVTSLAIRSRAGWPSRSTTMDVASNWSEPAIRDASRTNPDGPTYPPAPRASRAQPARRRGVLPATGPARQRPPDWQSTIFPPASSRQTSHELSRQAMEGITGLHTVRMADASPQKKEHRMTKPGLYRAEPCWQV